ncbi:hypothetical protein JOD43_003202 [Pullulanibacillus pueri]|uniref:DUF4190 domain-containing protein n=1 Tax=Pullulanibacillus pueri TaxID=1437324 RepID=A0A8J2ZYC5_9BACL|nr:DUF4190 domain-containing protein [Pullulanibacillus pueri]MBM7683023.1 hypothetical protein [Pullulanibacillus pueri]GGH85037.1 hypothetical protein GCM10007096_29500 [Pullulanibacillus pueri]
MADKDQSRYDERDVDHVNSLWYGDNASDTVSNAYSEGDNDDVKAYSEGDDEDVEALVGDSFDGTPRNVVDDDYEEEYAAESAIDRSEFNRVDADVDEHEGTGIGWLALILSVIGLFFLPIIMGAAGIIIGIIARKQGAKALGAWAIGVGIAAIVIMLFTAPFF